MLGLHQLLACLLYGCTLRLMECLRPRVKDIDFEQSQVVVREGKGEKDKQTGVLSLHGPCQATLDLAQIVVPNKTHWMRY